MEQRIDHMKYLPNMEVLEESNIMNEVITRMNSYDYENYTLENKELSLDKQSITSEINFKEKYNNLMTAYNSIKSSYDKLQQSQEDYGVSSKKYSLGFITKNELEKAKLDLDSKMSDFNSERNDFYLKYLDYTQMKEGY